VLILFATSAAGVLYGYESQRYLEKLVYIRHLLQMLKGEMEYAHIPLSEAFFRLAKKVKQPYRTWMRALEMEIEERRDAQFSSIWRRSIDTYLQELNLKAVHKNQLKELGDYLGQLDPNTSRQTLEAEIARWEIEVKKVREALATKKRIATCLGVMSGIFLIVILI
jgi:stage III sporulation protein AB